MVSLFENRNTAQKMEFSIKDFFSRSDQICSFLYIFCTVLHMLKRPIKENDYTVKKFLCRINVTKETAQLTFTCSKLTKQALEKGVKYVQRYQ